MPTPNEVVNVYIPAVHGRYVGLPGFIEVQIEATRPSIFGGIIGKAAWPVGAFAVATNSQNLTFPFSMLALDPTECKAIAVSGGGVVEAYANIQSNSSGADCTGDPDRVQPDRWRHDRRPSPQTRPAASWVSSRIRASGPPIDVHDRPELVRPARPAAQPAGAGQAAARAADGLRGDRYASARHPEELPGRDPAPRTKRHRPSARSRRPAGRRTCPWILYPGLYPGGLEVTQGRTVYLMPGIYWIGGGGLDIGGGGSIVTIATEAMPTPPHVRHGDHDRDVVRRRDDLQLEAPGALPGVRSILN